MIRAAPGCMVVAVMFTATLVTAAPYVPDDDQQVLETVTPADDPAYTRLQTLRNKVLDNPDDLDAAAGLIRHYIELARKQGDPRYAGYAEAVLAPWLDQPFALATTRVLRATLRQYRHDFDGAIEDLDQVLASDQTHAQARLTRASLHQVRADYPAAELDCRAVSSLSLVLVRQICLAGVLSLTGNAEAAYRDLEVMLAEIGAQQPQSLTIWAHQTLGDIAVRRGMVAAAERHYRTAIAAGGEGLILITALFDLLLDDGRAEEARALLGDDLRADALLLRHALAAQALNDERFDRLARDLEARFVAAARRGEQRHLREEARFRLLLRDQAAQSLDLAKLNWKSQREPEDARVLLEAALAAEQPAAAKPVIDWADQAGVEDVRLAPLIALVERTVR